jgi:16S rRNA (guanine966-N2)-methyltransferase
MRIVAGTFRGRPLVAPKGQSTRPTADRARQAIFNVLEHAAWSPGLDGLRALDLFAGSGALGIEAISRGADFCLFVDRAEDARAAIRANIQTLKLDAQTRVDRRDAAALGRMAPGDGPPFDIAFLDPPYGSGLGEKALAALAAGGWLAADALVVLERGAAEAVALPASYAPLDERAWGAARVSFARWSPLAP